MHINVEHGDQYATLHLRGEFDTFYCKKLQEEIDALASSGIVRVSLNLRLVKFINSTALGAIIKASKSLTSKSGKLVIARPSSFCRDIITKVGVDRVVPIHDTDEEAVKALFGGVAPAPKAAAAVPEDESSLLFSPTDLTRIEHFLSQARRNKGPINPVHGHAFGSNWTGVGRMSSLDERGLHFTWNGGDTGLDAFAMGQLLSIGIELKVKFRLPLFQSGYCEALAVISEVEERDNGVKIGAAFSKIDDKTLAAVRQYSADMKFLKDELRKATGA
ncbi:MAG: STAS domain-containing protein [Planctomycetes bacterium]|nr:STAS domain-containing protein [Planctomycetota bacterium]